MSDHPAHHLAAQSDEVSSLPPDAWTGSAAGPDTSDVWPHRAPARREEVPMGVFERMAEHGHEQVVFCYDRTTGMKAIIAIHNTTLGPARGGTRLRTYQSEEDALDDVLRLSNGMTYKFAHTDMPRGGGKAVVLADPASATDKPTLLRVYGRFVQLLAGRFGTGHDLGSPDLRGRRVAVQGLGGVGAHLAQLLVQGGASVTGADADPARAKEVADQLGIALEDPDRLYDVECEVFSPNAVGGVLSERTVPRLRCRIVAGGANNQLAAAKDGRRLFERGILYAPDYVINSAAPYAVIGAGELGYSPERLAASVRGVAEALGTIFRRAQLESRPTAEVADQIAEERIAAAASLRAMAEGTGARPAAGRGSPRAGSPELS